MGQGVAVTRLQMAMAVGAIANGGVLMRPMLVKQLQDSDGNVVQKYEPQAVRRVVSEDTAKQMVEALKTVVSKDGTAPLASLANYVVAGKTGTAQKVVDGKYVERPICRFVHRIFPGGQSADLHFNRDGFAEGRRTRVRRRALRPGFS